MESLTRLSNEALEWFYEEFKEQFTPEQLSSMAIHKEIERRKGNGQRTS